MAYSEAGSSSDAAQVSGGKYQVFLNFRGPDTRYGFTDFLYHGLINVGVRVFMDDEKLSVSKAIGGDLHAIDDPIIYIPIFSRTYASSIRCLRDLGHIVDNVSMSKGTKSILPVFIGVKPDDVKLKTPLYEDALLKHKERFPDEVERWRAALAEVGGIKGWNWDGNQSPALIVESIVDKVLVKLATRKKVVTEHLVGLDDRIKELTELLDVDHPDVQLIGIYGMGGIGKTTVAKVVFNTLSSHFGKTCCFLENVRECSLTMGIVQLQKNILSDIVGIKPVEIVNNYEHGMMMIEEVLSTKKVLVVLDDVAEKQHIEYLIGRRPLALGSRIIITTRDQTIMPGKWFNSDIRQYEIPKMDDAVALQLFCRHAFDRDFPLNDYRKLSNEIVSTTGQLPLAIEVIGSLLKGQGKEFWQGMLINLRNAPNREVRKKLQISYDGLDKFEKQIFLDIACFFFNEKKIDAIYVWDDCQLDPIIGINILTQKCLIKVLDNGKLWMHNQLIALGRQIVREDSQDDLEKQSRLWIAKEVIKIMGTLERKDKVEALLIDGLDHSVEIRNEEFERLQNLRLLKLGNGTYTGDFAKCRSKLRWISWRSPHQGFKANNMHLDYLLVFKLDKNGFTDDSKAWDLIKRARNLKVLSLIECHGITTTPDFSKCLGLERLTLLGCSRLKKIESFIGYLPSLIELEIEECKGLTVLPKEVGALGKLVRFSLWGCSRLRELPSSIGNITTLIELDLSYTGIIKLPNSIQDLVKLESFLLRDTRLTELSASIEKLKSLRVLCLSISGLSSLEHVWQVPSGINMLKNLEELDLSGRVEMKGEILVGIKELSSLVILNLRECHRIQVLPELPTSLTFLFLQSESLLSVPNLSNFTNLVELLLSDDSRNTGKSNLLPSCDLRWIGRLSRLKKLELNLLNVPAPQELASLSHLEELTLCYLDLETLVQLPSSRWSLGNLSTLEFYRCEVEAIPLEKLPRLKKLNIDGCKQLERLYIPLELRNLRQAWVSRCPKLVEIQVLGLSVSLESLRVYGCESLIRIGGLSDLKNLGELVIQQCNVLTKVEGLHELESLKSLDVKECMSLTKVIDAFCTNIQDDCLVEISGCGDFIKQGATSLKRYKEETLLDKPNKRMKKMEDDGREQPADGETSDRNYCAIAAVQNVVGIDDRAKQIIDLLEMEVNDEVCIIGIYGIDGIGKTTLAKAVYDQISSCFDSCSFLAEVEETTQNSRGIQFLQNKFICDILERDHEDLSFDETIKDFVDIFCEMKVLIVVDAVEKPSDLHAIVGDQLHWFGPGSRVIVTSQNEEILGGYDSDKAATYKVSELDDGQAFELFCKHAFRMQSSMPDYDGLSNRIVNATKKLPLAVEVIGSFLRGKSIQEWEKMEKAMKARPMSSQKTMVGLQELLDICYGELDHRQKDIFLDIACFISGVDARIASYMWPNCYPSSGCILVPLAKIGENNELQMHRLLRRLGKKMFEQEGSGDPIGRKFYIQEKEMENVEALCLDYTAGDFQMMPELRFLRLDNAKVSGNFEGALASLRWLCWQRCPLDFSAKNFLLTELVILDLSWSKVTEEWGGWSEIKMNKLKVLNLTGCSVLLFTPDFSGYEYLEILILERCSHLVKLDPSIGNLKRLVSLNLKFCSQLNGLPVELGCTTALKELFLDGTSVRQIPISIGNLKQLEILSGLKCFPLTHLPSSICYLAALSELSLDGAKISKLPSSLGELLKLRRLSLRDCRYLGKLPYSIGEMRSLEELDISATSIPELPDSIRKLKSLRVLRMDSSFIRAIPGEIGNLTKLEELHASWCPSLKGAIPGDIEALHRLRSLTLGHSSISSLPPEISTISGLHTLDLIQCNEIEKLPKLAPSLICLRVSSKRMKAIRHLGNLKELEELCLSDGDPKARRPPSAIEEIEGFEGLKALKRLDISNCKIRNINGIGQLTSLGSLILSYCDYLDSLPDLSNLKSLKVLEIRRCKMIHQIEGLEKLTTLEKLNIRECPAENSVQVQNARKDVRARLKGKLCTG
ncbi:hypothetical protein ACJRO7_015344 [Eucalyptus globulus]|uniref:TIR domain-containing protein n=1 Tax=Eucalyptus globulus TaxID=34317 RepID=A0ABD3L3A1_EUCGL